jgi:hypothetical protein
MNCLVFLYVFLYHPSTTNMAWVFTNYRYYYSTPNILRVERKANGGR